MSTSDAAELELRGGEGGESPTPRHRTARLTRTITPRSVDFNLKEHIALFPAAISSRFVQFVRFIDLLICSVQLLRLHYLAGDFISVCEPFKPNYMG